MRQHSITYTLFFSAAVCVVCSLFVSAMAVGLKQKQEENAIFDRQRNVLMAVGALKPGSGMSRQEIMKLYDEKVQPVLVDMKAGEYDEGADVTKFSFEAAVKDAGQSHEAPVNNSGLRRVPNEELIYKFMNGADVDMYVLPVRGMGLWSMLMGYVAISADTTTVKGLTFFSHGETPGLGGEIDNPSWKALWPGRKIYDPKGSVKLQVIKGKAGSPEESPYSVDGIAGATLTGRGVTNLLQFWMGENGYGKFLENIRKEKGVTLTDQKDGK